MSVPPPGRQSETHTAVPGEPQVVGEQPAGGGYVPKTKFLVLGIVFSVWGLGIVLRGLANPPQGNSAYVSGQRFAIVFGVVLLIVGARQLWLEYRARRDGAV